MMPKKISPNATREPSETKTPQVARVRLNSEGALPGMQNTSGHDGQAACAGQAGQLQSGHWAKYALAIRATLGHETSAPADRAAKEIVEEAIYKTNSP